MISCQPSLSDAVFAIPLCQRILERFAVRIELDIRIIPVMNIRFLFKRMQALENAVAQQVGIDAERAIDHDIAFRRIVRVVL